MDIGLITDPFHTFINTCVVTMSDHEFGGQYLATPVFLAQACILLFHHTAIHMPMASHVDVNHPHSSCLIGDMYSQIFIPFTSLQPGLYFISRKTSKNVSPCRKSIFPFSYPLIQGLNHRSPRMTSSPLKTSSHIAADAFQPCFSLKKIPGNSRRFLRTKYWLSTYFYHGTKYADNN